MIEEEIPSALAGERLDRIVALVADCSRKDAAALIEQSGVTLDGEPSLLGKVRVREHQVLVVDESKLPTALVPAADDDVEFGLVYSDDEVIVVDKPAGLVVHPGAGNPDGTLVNGLLAKFPELAEVGEVHRPGIVHRLDVGTSGLLVVARTQLAYQMLVAALASHSVGRVYRALVWDHPSNQLGVIDAPIGRDHRDPMRMAVVVTGKAARTRYRVLREYISPAAAALECRLETGRTHQIRVHLAAIGHPVVGDAAYGGAREAIASPRPFLHAAELEFVHPTSGKSMGFASPLPPDLAAVEAGLEQR